MEDLLAALDRFEKFSGWSIGWFIGLFFFALLIESWPHIRYRFCAWRIRRAARATSGLHPDEMRDYGWKQGEAPERFDSWRILQVTLVGTLQMIAPVLLADLATGDPLLMGPVAGLAAAWFLKSRQKQDAEPEGDGERQGPHIPDEAFWGFLLAMGMAGVVFMIASVLL
ncbi:hypothetical protein K3148_06500 [Qipengyuania aurantiaca]|uniref:Uncharacterized protein n=1 Tax=Qipengyuania aurantiaca TaxID=2867233 RepID=A0ABX8ZQ10_9SPHN|nr:hypothetical protein [Qipengyuania aurantiaca]QZD91029.1 hypothetical protein K3148_06500 [Qipengyuania aurantiaca]